MDKQIAVDRGVQHFMPPPAEEECPLITALGILRGESYQLLLESLRHNDRAYAARSMRFYINSLENLYKQLSDPMM